MAARIPRHAKLPREHGFSGFSLAALVSEIDCRAWTALAALKYEREPNPHKRTSFKAKKSVLRTLAERYPNCREGVDEIARKTGLRRRQVQRALRELEHKDRLIYEILHYGERNPGGRKATTQFFFNVDGLAKLLQDIEVAKGGEPGRIQDLCCLLTGKKSAAWVNYEAETRHERASELRGFSPEEKGVTAGNRVTPTRNRVGVTQELEKELEKGRKEGGKEGADPGQGPSPAPSSVTDRLAEIFIEETVTVMFRAAKDDARFFDSLPEGKGKPPTLLEDALRLFAQDGRHDWNDVKKPAWVFRSMVSEYLRLARTVREASEKKKT